MISDDIFRTRILAALDKPKKSKLVAIINSGFFLWILTLAVVTSGGAYLTSYQQCRKDSEEQIERNTKIQRELFQRELRIREIIMTSPTVAEIRNQLKQPISYYPEFSGFPILLLQESNTAFLNHVIDLKLAMPGKPLPRPEIMALYPVSRGQLPDGIADKDIPLLREYAMTMLAQATPIPLPGYGISAFEPECGFSTLWARFFFDPAAKIIRTGKPTLPNILPLPQPGWLPPGAKPQQVHSP
ncbi:hypothetical protein ACVOMS_11135 [Bradyrhizobium guangxiense]